MQFHTHKSFSILFLLSTLCGLCFACMQYLVISFAGITGPVAIDELGDRIADFDFFHLHNTATLEFKVHTALSYKVHLTLSKIWITDW